MKGTFKNKGNTNIKMLKSVSLENEERHQMKNVL